MHTAQRSASREVLSGADPTAVVTTLKAIRLVKAQFGLNVTLGASTVSFGLPGRHALVNWITAHRQARAEAATA